MEVLCVRAAKEVRRRNTFVLGWYMLDVWMVRWRDGGDHC
jgi:hypothetical protein